MDITKISMKTYLQMLSVYLNSYDKALMAMQENPAQMNKWMKNTWAEIWLEMRHRHKRHKVSLKK